MLAGARVRRGAGVLRSGVPRTSSVAIRACSLRCMLYGEGYARVLVGEHTPFPARMLQRLDDRPMWRVSGEVGSRRSCVWQGQRQAEPSGIHSVVGSQAIWQLSQRVRVSGSATSMPGVAMEDSLARLPVIPMPPSGEGGAIPGERELDRDAPVEAFAHDRDIKGLMLSIMRMLGLFGQLSHGHVICASKVQVGWSCMVRSPRGHC